MKLNLACGQDIRKGYINCDQFLLKGVNKKIDLEKKLPFKNNSATEIIAFKILEHLHNPLTLMEEMHRVSKNKAIIKIIAPHTSNVNLYGCLHHFRTGINLQTFNLFLEDNKGNYQTTARYKIKYYEYQMPNIIAKKGFWSFYRKRISKRFMYQTQSFLKKHPRFVEYHLAKLINLGHFYVELEVIK